ncbi:hypothetical protein [Bradyrhizobium sp. NAS80.1]|uniref:hypothetical protein n=1 Tax=Bradyrhizobium sp. NAS80.1 TaxID=1680159 RepID=UPI0011612122|nr:hypothetical protein [Bradyrhizobium sp. NAS80.1]
MPDIHVRGASAATVIGWNFGLLWDGISKRNQMYYRLMIAAALLVTAGAAPAMAYTQAPSLSSMQAAKQKNIPPAQKPATPPKPPAPAPAKKP